MSSTVAESWDRIHAWLAQHAPKIQANLNPGASDEEIAATERALGHEMPEDWRECYRVHNGMNESGNAGTLIHGLRLYDLPGVVAAQARDDAERQENTQILKMFTRLSAADVGINKRNIANVNWIPFLFVLDETLLRIDLEPTPEGRRGQVIFPDDCENVGVLIAPSVADLLSTFVVDLYAGRYFLFPESLKNGVEELVPIPELDVYTWRESPRWRHLAEAEDDDEDDDADDLWDWDDEQSTSGRSTRDASSDDDE